MDWSSPFIVYRITAAGKLEEVFHAEDLNKAKYWLTYIAKPGDVLCKTPKHPTHSGTCASAEYWSHKDISGTPSSTEENWKKIAQEKSCEIVFPDQQFKSPVA
jgi:hypothetical protein